VKQETWTMSAVASVSNATGTTAHATQAHHQGRHGTPQKTGNAPPANAASTAKASSTQSVTSAAARQSSKANLVV
jgi:hypothetical protein